MSESHLTPDVFTADYIGEPGRRAFFLQSRVAGATRSFLVEKQQVSVLAEKLRELLLLVDENDTIHGATPARDPALGLHEPVEAEWRVGTMGLAYDEDDDLVVLFAQPADEQDEGERLSEQAGLRFFLRRDQVRSFVLHAMAVVAEGRPTCQLCGLPIDPAGHLCPASNGHRSGTDA